MYLSAEPDLATERGRIFMLDIVFAFLMSVLAGIVANIICDLIRKWFDSHKK